MENQELLAQVLQALKEQTDVMTQMVDEKIQLAKQEINLKIENDVSKRIDALFDGYTLTHEKQRETDRKLAELERRVEKLENAGEKGAWREWIRKSKSYCRSLSIVWMAWTPG